MIIGVPKEIKNNESRVGLTPACVQMLVKDGHSVYIEKNAGIGSGFTDNEYIEAGALILDNAEEVYSIADMVIKVKEPVEPEYALLKEGQILFTYLHLAADEALTRVLMDKKITSIAYETVQTDDGKLPLLIPMSEVAGRMSVQIGARLLEKPNGGKGILIGGTPGTECAKVLVIGAGTVGLNAARMALGLGADVTVMDINLNKLAEIDNMYSGRIKTLCSNSMNLQHAVSKSDLVISTILIPGAKAPKIVTEEMVKSMSKGSVIVDVAIDQGGSVETVDHATTHENPTFEKYGVIHYSVANIPGAVARTSTMALTNATLHYAGNIANKGVITAINTDTAICRGVNTMYGRLTYKPVANALDIEYTPIDDALDLLVHSL
ncbi:MAG: alanine dehydrogenase [Candidatus Gastranaerophilales bacterium]|nr:alanine dehydrogenase [Candidatus Gastranaerophilales bacterium]